MMLRNPKEGQYSSQSALYKYSTSLGPWKGLEYVTGHA